MIRPLCLTSTCFEFSGRVGWSSCNKVFGDPLLVARGNHCQHTECPTPKYGSQRKQEEYFRRLISILRLFLKLTLVCWAGTMWAPTFSCILTPAQVSVLILFLAGKRCMQSYTSLENCDKNWPRPNVTEILDPQPFPPPIQSRTNKADPPLFASSSVLV